MNCFHKNLTSKRLFFKVNEAALNLKCCPHHLYHTIMIIVEIIITIIHSITSSHSTLWFPHEASADLPQDSLTILVQYLCHITPSIPCCSLEYYVLYFISWLSGVPIEHSVHSLDTFTPSQECPLSSAILQLIIKVNSSILIMSYPSYCYLFSLSYTYTHHSYYSS